MANKLQEISDEQDLKDYLKKHGTLVMTSAERRVLASCVLMSGVVE